MPRAPKNYLRGNPKLPWEEYEGQVRNVLASSGAGVYLHVEGKRTLKAGDAEYEVDAYAEVKVFGGAVIKVIIECKRHTKPVTRDLVLALYAKTQELGAHKAMMFSTSGFQKGAVNYAKKHGIALVKLAKRRRTSTTTYVLPCMAPDDDACMVSERSILYVNAQMDTPPGTRPSIEELEDLLSTEEEPPKFEPPEQEDPPEQEEPPKFEPPLLALYDDSTYVGVLVSASDASMTIQDWLGDD